MKTAVTEMPGSRVRVEVEVEPDEVARRVERAAAVVGRDLRVPGFRKGKAPAAVVMQRVGREAVVDQALRESLPEWYEQALIESGVSPVGDPQVQVTGVPDSSEQPLGFSFEVGVRPAAELGEYKGLEVGRAEAEVPDDVLERELERLRESAGRLQPVERAAADGDYLVVDFEGSLDGEPFEGGKASDYLLELGSGQLIEGFEEQLRGAEAGDARTVEVTFPDDYGADHLAGRAAQFAVSVKEVREKVLPELDDDLAAEVSEFDTVDELRDDLREKLAHAAEHRIDAQFREAAVDAVVDQARIEIPDEIARARAQERWERVERGLAARGVSPEAYLQVQGKSRDELVAEAQPDAERELQREAVLAAVADAEGIEVSEEELLEALTGAAEAEGRKPEKVLAQLRERGRDKLLAEDIRLRKAVDVVADAATPIPVGQAEAREQLWTPEKEREQAGALWTPGA